MDDVPPELYGERTDIAAPGDVDLATIYVDGEAVPEFIDLGDGEVIPNPDWVPEGGLRCAGIAGLGEVNLGKEPERVAYQVFAWAEFTVRNEGYLDDDRESHPLVRRCCIQEPGGKVRIVTASEAAVVTFL
jgi:hypothetical protein